MLSVMTKPVVAYMVSIEFVLHTFLFTIDLQDKQAHGTQSKFKKKKKNKLINLSHCLEPFTKQKKPEIRNKVTTKCIAHTYTY